MATTKGPTKAKTAPQVGVYNVRRDAATITAATLGTLGVMSDQNGDVRLSPAFASYLGDVEMYLLSGQVPNWAEPDPSSEGFYNGTGEIIGLEPRVRGAVELVPAPDEDEPTMPEGPSSRPVYSESSI